MCGVLWTTRARVAPLLHPTAQGGILTGAACMDSSRYWLPALRVPRDAQVRAPRAWIRRSIGSCACCNGTFLWAPHIRIRPDCGLCQSFSRFMDAAYADSPQSYLLRSLRRSLLVDDACTDLCRSSVCTLAAMSSFCGCYVHGFVAKTPLFYIYELLVHRSRYQTPQQSRECGSLNWENMEDGGGLGTERLFGRPTIAIFCTREFSKKMAFFADWLYQSS